MLKRLYLAVLLVSAVGALAQAQTYQLAPVAHQQFFNASGGIASGYKLCTYAAGTTTPATTYSDTAGTALPNPITLNSVGRPQTAGNVETGIYLNQTQSYKFILDAPGSGNTCNGTAVGATIWSQDNITAPGLPTGMVTMTHDATGLVWTVYKPDGSVLPTPGTTTQGLQEAINYANNNHYDFQLRGGGGGPAITLDATITCSTGLTIPAGNHRNYHFGAVNLSYTGPASSDFLTIDSMDVTLLDMRQAQFIYSGTGAIVRLLPANLIDTGNFTGMTSSTIDLGTLSGGSSSIGLRITPGQWPIIGMHIHVQEIQTATTAVQIDNPTTNATGFELNEINLVQIHNVTASGTALQIGSSSTQAAHLSGNLWTGLINAGNASVTDISTWGINDTFRMALRAGATSTGILLNSSAAQNSFYLAENQTTTPWTDNSTTKDNVRIDTRAGIVNFPGWMVPTGATHQLFVSSFGSTTTDIGIGQGAIIGMNGVTAANNPTNASLLRLQSLGGVSGSVNIYSDSSGTGHGQPVIIGICSASTCNPIMQLGLRDTSGGGVLIGQTGTIPATGNLTVIGGVQAGIGSILGAGDFAGSGNLYMGPSGTSVYRTTLVENGNARVAYLKNTNASFTDTNLVLDTTRAANSAFKLLAAYSNGALQASIDGVGQGAFNSVTTTPTAFASLPGSPATGQCVWITDSNTATYNATVAGGGSNKILTCYDGTNWKAH